MRLIEIAEGLSINPEQVNLVMRKDDGTAMVIVGDRTLQSSLSYESVKALIRAEEHREDVRELQRIASPLIGQEPVKTFDMNPYRTDPAW